MLSLYPTLSPSATLAHVLPGMKNSSLLSIGQLCDDGWTAVFHKLHLHVFKNAQIILRGIQNKSDGLWDVTIKPDLLLTKHKYATINAIIRKNQTKTELVDYLQVRANLAID